MTQAETPKAIPQRPAKVSLIATDMDGTLFNAKKEITPRNMDALRSAAKMGIYIVLASGRIFPNIQKLSQSIVPGQPYLSSNGAIIGINGQQGFLRRMLLDDALAALILDEAKRYSSLEIHLHTFDGRMLHLLRDGQITGIGHAQEFIGGDGLLHQHMPARELLAQGRGQTIKYTINGEPAQLNLLRALFSRYPLEIASSWWDNIEVMPKGADKGSGLKFLADHLHIPLSEVMAFGDNQNDLTMLQTAGCSVAMENANEEAKQAAWYVTASCEDSGVGRAIERFVL